MKMKSCEQNNNLFNKKKFYNLQNFHSKTVRFNRDDYIIFDSVLYNMNYLENFIELYFDIDKNMKIYCCNT